MTDSEYRSAMADAAWLAGCAVRQEVPDRRRLSGVKRKNLLAAAEKHKLVSAVGMALESAGIRDPDYVKATAAVQRRIAILDADRAAVLNRLEEAGIWYMPLKGAVLKDLYPRFGMREMADNDILFDAERAGDVRRIMTGLGFSVEEYDEGNHDAYHKRPVSNFEMHRTLFSSDDPANLYPYYAGVKDRLVREEGKRYGYRFRDEDFYLYMTAHEYKHYTAGGTGLRSLLDAYVYLRSKQPDMVHIAEEAAKIGISGFERKNRELALHLFDGAELTQEEGETLEYILYSGTYGTQQNRIANQIAEKGRGGYFLSRLFPSRAYLSVLFPVLKKAPFLYPFCWAARMARGFLIRRKQMKTQLRAALGLPEKKNRKTAPDPGGTDRERKP